MCLATSGHQRLRKVQVLRALSRLQESAGLKKRMKPAPEKAERKWPVRPIFQDHEMFGAWFTLIPTLRATDPEGFYNFMRMTVDTFDRLLELLGPCLQKSSNRKFVCPGEMLAITLRY